MVDITVTENIGLFVEYFLKDLSNVHPSYLQDTPDFLREVEILNDEIELPENTILLTIDVTGLYTNIPIEEGIEAAREALQEREDIRVPTEFIIRMLEAVLKHNIFLFNKELFVQLIGTAMGSTPTPHLLIFLWQELTP